MKKRCLLSFAVLLGALLVIGGIAPVSAQEDGSDEFTLEEVTVTAQKRAESAQKVAITMEVIQAEDLKELGKNDIDEVLSGISNTIIEKAQEGYRITIRGITDNSESFKGQSMAPPAVAINLDGVYSNRKDTGSGLFDLERVEVLYGPQSTMYMSNSPGGVVNVVSANPKIDKYEASGLLEVGNYNLLHTQGSMNVPLGEKAALRGAFSTSVRDGYLNNGNDDEDTKSARLKALVQPSDDLSLVLTGEVSKNSAHGFGSGVVAFDNGDGHWYVSSGDPGSLPEKDGEVTDPWTGNDLEKTTSNAQTSKKIYAQMNWDTAVGSLSVTPAYSERDGNSTFIFNDPGTGEETSYMVQSGEEKSVELRMTSPEDFPFKWIIGATYYKSYDRGFDRSETYLDSDPVTVDPDTGLVADEGVTFANWGRMSDREMTNTNKAYYVNVTYPITEAFRATGGVRQSWDEMYSDNEEIRGAPDLAPGELRYEQEIFVMENDGEPDWKFGVEYDMGTNSMLYADYATSYRVQGMGGGPPGTETNYDPERLKAYTLGAKNRFLDNRLQLNAAAYYYDYRNYRATGNDFQYWVADNNGNGLPDTGQDANEVVGARTTNAASGDGRMYGLDLSVNAILTQKDRLTMTASYIKSEWTDLVLWWEYADILELVDGVMTEVHRPYTDLKGETMMSTPPLSVNLRYDHSFSLPNGGALKAALSVKYKTSYDLSWREIDYPINYQESYHMEDIDLVYNAPDGKWTLTAYVKNVTDYAEKRTVLNMAGSKLLSIGNPRTYGAVLSMNF